MPPRTYFQFVRQLEHKLREEAGDREDGSSSYWKQAVQLAKPLWREYREAGHRQPQLPCVAEPDVYIPHTRTERCVLRYGDVARRLLESGEYKLQRTDTPRTYRIESLGAPNLVHLGQRSAQEQAWLGQVYEGSYDGEPAVVRVMPFTEDTREEVIRTLERDWKYGDRAARACEHACPLWTIQHAAVDEERKEVLVFMPPLLPGIPVSEYFADPQYDREQMSVLADNFLQLVRTLHAMHESSLLHGAITPHNLWYAEDERRIYLTNFAYACRGLQCEPPRHLPSLLWSDPRVYAGTRSDTQGRWLYDASSDLYGLAITFTFLILGAPDGSMHDVPRTDWYRRGQYESKLADVARRHRSDNSVQLMLHYLRDIVEERTRPSLQEIVRAHEHVKRRRKLPDYIRRPVSNAWHSAYTQSVDT